MTLSIGVSTSAPSSVAIAAYCRSVRVIVRVRSFLSQSLDPFREEVITPLVHGVFQCNPLDVGSELIGNHHHLDFRFIRSDSFQNVPDPVVRGEPIPVENVKYRNRC